MKNTLFIHAKTAIFPLTILVISSVFQSILLLGQARILSKIISLVYLSGYTLDGVWNWLWLLLAIMLSRGLLFWVSEIASADAAVRIKIDLRKTLQTHIYSLGKEYIDKHDSGKMASILIDSVEALDGYISLYIPQIILSVLIPVLILFIILPMDLLTFVVFLVTVPLMPVFMYLIGSSAEKITKQQWLILARMRSFFVDLIQGMKTLIIFDQQDHYITRVRKVSDRYRTVTLNILKITFLSAFALEFIATISTALVAVETGLRLLNGKLEFEIAFFILLVAPEFYYPLRQLGMRFHAGITGKTAIDNITNLLTESVPNILPVPRIQMINASLQPKTIEFDKVTYQYQDREVDAIRNISFKIKCGENIALVGSSGSGKSTIFYILLRLLRTYQGNITVDGTELSQLSDEIWCPAVSWVPQFPYIFQGTIEENIRMGDSNVNIVDVINASKKASFHNFVDSLPMRYETSLGEAGYRLSGGQIQRLALARAFLRDTPVLLLDEPTAHLDPDLEEELRDTVRLLATNRTVITVAHRLTTIYKADSIILLDKGSLVDKGTHQDLISSGGLYYQMIQSANREIS